MDKQTLSNYGWIVICTLVLVVMIALSGPFGTFVSEAVQSTTQGLFDVNQNALDAAGIEMQEQKFDTMLNGGNAGQTPVVTPAVTLADGTTMTWEEAKTQYGVTDTKIPTSAFQHANITSIEIPYGVTTIGKYAFQGCSTLEAIKIPASVTTIGNYAFQGCASLTTVEFLGLVQPLGGTGAFSGVFATVYVPADYESDSFCGDSFCGMPVVKK